ncbi:MAG: M10 family metallopeptidase C-terminal domain-containing protein, partial [Lacipirellulaceae bacterium]
IDLSRVSEEHFPSLVINGIPGTIEIRGGAGDDTIFGTALRDTIYGDAGNDEIFGGEDIDAIYGGEGEDVLQGGDGNDNLYGEAGNDRLFGGDGDDSLEGGEGDDRLVGNAGDDTLEGEAGDDLLEGGSGTLVLLDGGEGSDRYLLTEKSATYVLIVDEGTVGIDEIDLSQTLLAIPDTYNASGFPAELDLDSNTAQPVFDATLASVNLTIAVGSQIENAPGTRSRDKLTGSTSSNVLRGGLGDDVLLGGDGADELLGEGGDDTLNPGGTPTNEVDLLVGGFGDDVYQLSDDVTTTARINDEAGTDKIDLSTWTGTEGATLDLSLTPDDAAYQTLLEETDNPKLQLSNSGLDQIEEIIGTDNDDVLMGNDLDNVIASGEGSDTLDGKSGNNILLGQKGYDALEVADNVDDAEDASIGYLDVGSGWIPADGGFNGAQRSADNNDVANEATWSFTDLPAGDYDVYVTWSVSEGTPGSSAIYSVGNETFAVSQAENPSGSVVGGTAWHRLENPQANSEGRFTVDSSVDFTVTLAHDAGNGASDVIYADAVRVVRRNQAPSITLGTPAVGHGTIDGAIWEVDNVAELEITVGDGDEDASLLVLDDSLTSVPGVSLDRVGMTAVWKLSYDGTTLDKTHAIILQVADGTDTTTKTVYLRNTNSTNPIAIVDIDSQTSGFVFNLHEANDDDNDPLKTLSVTVNATVANGLDKKFSLGPGAPAGADIDGNGLLTWSPTEDQDGTHQIEVRVTDTGNPPLRVSEWITVNVADIDDVPVLPSDPELVHDTGIANDSRTADAALRGTVTNDGSVDLIEIEVDYDNNGTYDEVVQVEASEDDPSLGYYTINPEESDLVFDAS